MTKKKEPSSPIADKLSAFIDELVANHTIKADVAALIKHAIEAKKAQLG